MTSFAPQVRDFLAWRTERSESGDLTNTFCDPERASILDGTPRRRPQSFPAQQDAMTRAHMARSREAAELRNKGRDRADAQRRGRKA